MRQQFLRIYIGMAIVLFLGAIATIFIVNQRLEALRRTRFLERMRGSATAISQHLAEAGEDSTRRAEILARHGRWWSLTVKPFGELALSPEMVQQMQSGEAVAAFTDTGPQAYAKISEAEVLAMGVRRRPRGPAPDGRPGRGRPRPGPLRGTEYIFLGILASILLLIGAAIYFLVRPLERRIHRLSEVAERFGQGDLESRAEVDSADAVAELASTFNAMADRIEGLLEGQKELLRAVSHEFRTPLARLFFVLDEAQSTDSPEEKTRHLLRIQGSLTELNDLVEELLTFVRLEGDDAAPEMDRVDVGAVLREMPGIVSELRDDLAVHVDCSTVYVRAIPRYFRRAVLNLVTNAVRHAKTDIWLEGRQEDGSVFICIDDDGPGIPPDVRDKVFEPFSRLDESRTSSVGGAGLGLAIVQRIMGLQAGSAEVSESPRGGARFTLAFPAEPTQRTKGDA
ncbi:MAG: ATP-binding protein [Candidatus Latescibacteria bacterium]|nr:ATP-binding protein [Candidatus Latescibacterota bacterium]